VCVVGTDTSIILPLKSKDLHRSFDNGAEMDHLSTNAKGILNFLSLCLVVIPFPSTVS
jgi:hypothetical protein